MQSPHRVFKCNYIMMLCGQQSSKSTYIYMPNLTISIYRMDINELQYYMFCVEQLHQVTHGTCPLYLYPLFKFDSRWLETDYYFRSEQKAKQNFYFCRIYAVIDHYRLYNCVCGCFNIPLGILKVFLVKEGVVLYLYFFLRVCS